LTILLIVFSAALIVLLIMLLGGGSAVRTPVLQNGIRFERAIYGFGPDVHQLITPASVTYATNPTRIWCTDQGNFRLVEFNYDGTYRTSFIRDVAGTPFDFPSGIAVSPDGWFYVAQSTYNKVTVYSPLREYEQKLESPNPMSVAVNDNLVVIGCVPGFALFDREGTYLKWVGTRGSGEDQFDTINGVALDADDNIYIVDSFNNRLSKYSKDASLVWMVNLGDPGNQRSDATPQTESADVGVGMEMPMGITIDGARRLIIVDNLANKIVAYDSEDGSFINEWGAGGSSNGLLQFPADISYSEATDTFVVADTGNRRLQIIRLPGSGATVESTVVRTATGPLRVCLIPGMIVVLLVGVRLVLVYLKKKGTPEGEYEVIGSVTDDTDNADEAVERVTYDTSDDA
jgi:sugar lactone lactonase YvrE